MRLGLVLDKWKSVNLKKKVDVCANLHKQGGYSILAVCDKDLLGKILEEDGIVFNVNRDFYDGIKMDIDEAFDLISKSNIINMVGREIVGAAISRGLVHSDAVLEICGIPHAQIVKM